MDIKTVYKKLHKFTARATGLEDMHVIFANQQGARPSKPFVTIDLRSIKQVGTPLIKRIDKEGIESSIMSMTATVTFQCFAGKLFEAEEFLAELALKFNTELANEIFEQEIAKRRTIKAVTMIPAFIDSQLEHQAIFEIEIAFKRAVTYRVGLIEKIELNNSINNEKITL